ncbi:MAG: ankyrin repeat domain-containing protein [Pirellulales bacterium]|jgi:ankyrin repeat protein
MHYKRFLLLAFLLGILGGCGSERTPTQNNSNNIEVSLTDGLVEFGTSIGKELADQNPELLSQFENSPLHNAASYGELEEAESLLKNGANVNQQDHFGNTPLHHVATYTLKNE